MFGNIAATILHETLYVYLKEKLLIKSDHYKMANIYILPMANAIIEIYPGISLVDAKDLAWGGLQKTLLWSLKSQFEKERIVKTNYDYRHNSCIPNYTQTNKGSTCVN